MIEIPGNSQVWFQTCRSKVTKRVMRIVNIRLFPLPNPVSRWSDLEISTQIMGSVRCSAQYLLVEDDLDKSLLKSSVRVMLR